MEPTIFLEFYMPVVVACPKCQSKYQLPDTSLGKTIECKKCSTKFPAAVVRQTASADVARQGTAQASPTSSKYVEGAAADELAKFGLDGPLRRQPDPSTETYVPPQKDILGNFASDPGFSAAQSVEVKSKGKLHPEGMEAIIANPHANQSRSTIPVSEMSLLPGVGYAPLKTSASIAVAAWIVALVCYLINTGIIVYFAYLFWNASPGSPPPVEPEFAMTLLRVVGITALVSWVVTPVLAFALSMFTFQSYQNLQAMGTKELAFGSVMGAFSWLIPLANWVLPCICVAEVARASRRPVGDQWKQQSTPIKVWIWWALVCLFWIGSFVSMATVKVTSGLGDESLESFQTSTTMAAIMLSINLILLIAAVGLFGLVAFEIAANQDKAWPAARKSRQGTGKPAPSAIPYVYASLFLLISGIALAVVSVLLIIKATRLVDPTVVGMTLIYGGSGLLPILAIAALAYGVIYSIKAFK
jgi:hypothetical protein